VAVSTRTCSSALASRILDTWSRPITGKGHRRVDRGLSWWDKGRAVGTHSNLCPFTSGIAKPLTWSPVYTLVSMQPSSSSQSGSTSRIPRSSN
jgi:hypothetical protein